MPEAPEMEYARKTGLPTRKAGVGAGRAPRLDRAGLAEDFAREAEDAAYVRPRPRRFTGLRFRLRGGVPRSATGRVVAGATVLAGLVAFTAGLWEARSLLLHDPRLLIQNSSSIQIEGNHHLTRPQLLSVFGEDVDRNLLTVPLAERQAELQRLPWVEHATVMRLLPNKMRIGIAERTPVAFVRQGSRIGLVDRSGVLLDMVPEERGSDKEAGEGVKAALGRYSFPVVTGMSAEEPESTRAARMKLYEKFLGDLDAGKDKVSTTLSEVDLSSPEDVKALIPSGSADILVHFGDDDFLARYLRYEERLPEWKAQYPKLASVDMRYEHQVVLEMSPGSAVPAAQGVEAPAAAAPVAAKKGKAAIVPAKKLTRAEATKAATAAKGPVAAVKAPPVAAKTPPVTAKSSASAAGAPSAKGPFAAAPSSAPVAPKATAVPPTVAPKAVTAAPPAKPGAPVHLQNAFDVHGKTGTAAGKSHPGEGAPQ